MNSLEIEQVVILITILIALVWAGISYLVGSAKENSDYQKWKNNSAEKLIQVPILFDSVTKILEKHTSPCTKCNGIEFQIWNILNDDLEIRCTNCKKKKFLPSDDNFKTAFDLYLDYVNLSYGQKNEQIRTEMFKYVKYDFDKLRRGSPMVRAIYFKALGEEKIRNKKKDNKQSRRISQKVKDMVWRRDEGKCVECGSQEKFEFDHIIPHSKGGSNTYRNIQLLCEECNRKKSAKIG